MTNGKSDEKQVHNSTTKDEQQHGKPIVEDCDGKGSYNSKFNLNIDISNIHGENNTANISDRRESHYGCSCACSPQRDIHGRNDSKEGGECDHDTADILNDEEERHFCNVCFSFLYYKKYCFYELLRIYRNFSSLTEAEKSLLTESIYCKLYKMYISVLNNYFFIFNILLPQISTHIILHLLAHTAHQEDVATLDDSSGEVSESSEVSDPSEMSANEVNDKIGGVCEGRGYDQNCRSTQRASATGVKERNQEMKQKKRKIRKIPREEYTINEIIKNLTEEEKKNIDKEYNYHNLDARVLCKDNPLIILKEIRSKLMNTKEDDYISKELQLKLEQSEPNDDFQNIDYLNWDQNSYKNEIDKNQLSHSCLSSLTDGDEKTSDSERTGEPMCDKEHISVQAQNVEHVKHDEQTKEEKKKKKKKVADHYNRQCYNMSAESDATINTPNEKGLLEEDCAWYDTPSGGRGSRVYEEHKCECTCKQGETCVCYDKDGICKCSIHREDYIEDYRKEMSEYAFPNLDGIKGEARLGEWRSSKMKSDENGKIDATNQVNTNQLNASSRRGEHIPPGNRITNAYSPSLDEYNLLQNMSKVRSTLRQFVRDWSLEGKHERDGAYEPILKSLEKYLPITDTYVPKILCPGSGLGRLPYEVAKKGYRSQGNEFSYFMLLASNFILNYYNEKDSLKIQPYCLNTLNKKGRDDHLKIITLPDINTYNKAILNTEFSMCAGELIEVYYNEKESFDGVLTCFFMDTAKNIFTYIRTFANILKPNSLWCNIGPLLYHYSEMTNEMSIELSWDEIKLIISKWFTFVEIEWIDNYYTTNMDSMMQVQYHCVFFSALRNDVPVDDGA
ncbi:hypothetical protein, conserved [Plasmodium gonderi]|uniref:carnosine N-methyltransferase n=1 Tax=Plasmodium gonderi TaxID=77519 RepID=A0A1Y1JHN0_PLAGO|nr:hypothetical protein, conserved [Plasmodium gonderi]GAW80727.1 hypothetical protein, conserved [Plasmodium gonderi]